jgi:hypothetical protein
MVLTKCYVNFSLVFMRADEEKWSDEDEERIKVADGAMQSQSS